MRSSFVSQSPPLPVARRMTGAVVVLDDDEDRITQLPYNVRFKIIDLLPLKHAIRTGVLSSKWKGLWKQRFPHTGALDFGREFMMSKSPEQYVHEVRFVLRHFCHPLLKVVQFRLFFYPSNDRHRAEVARWIKFMSVKKVDELYLDFSQGHFTDSLTGCMAGGGQRFQLPEMIFESESLTLVNLCYCSIGPGINLQKLRYLETLCLCLVDVTDDMLMWVIANCPNLEVLDLRTCLELKSVEGQSSRLKRLVVVHCWNVRTFKIVAPKLQYFHFSGRYEARYSILEATGLQEVIMCSPVDEPYVHPVPWVKMFQDFTQVKVLTLCRRILQNVVGSGFLPRVFAHLKELQLIMAMVTNAEMADIYNLFRYCRFPSLENVFIELPTQMRDPTASEFLQLPERSPPSVMFRQLKTIKMNNFNGHRNELLLFEFFLGRAINLEIASLAIPRMPHQSCLRGTPCSNCRELLITNNAVNRIKKASPYAIVTMHDRSNQALRPVHAEAFCKV